MAESDHNEDVHGGRRGQRPPLLFRNHTVKLGSKLSTSQEVFWQSDIVFSVKATNYFVPFLLFNLCKGSAEKTGWCLLYWGYHWAIFMHRAFVYPGMPTIIQMPIPPACLPNPLIGSQIYLWPRLKTKTFLKYPDMHTYTHMHATTTGNRQMLHHPSRNAHVLLAHSCTLYCVQFFLVSVFHPGLQLVFWFHSNATWALLSIHGTLC